MSGYAVIRKATSQDLEAIKQIADANKEAIGFVLRPALAQNIKRGWVLVAEREGVVIGFANYRHRQDDQTTLYEICVAKVEIKRGGPTEPFWIRPRCTRYVWRRSTGIMVWGKLYWKR